MERQISSCSETFDSLFRFTITILLYILRNEPIFLKSCLAHHFFRLTVHENLCFDCRSSKTVTSSFSSFSPYEIIVKTLTYHFCLPNISIRVSHPHDDKTIYLYILTPRDIGTRTKSVCHPPVHTALKTGR